MAKIPGRCPLLRYEVDDDMPPNEPPPAAPEAERGRYQFSLRTLLLGVTAAAVICSIASTVAWWNRHHPSRFGNWGSSCDYAAGNLPHFFVEAYEINGQMPTIACFARVDAAKRVRKDSNPMPWLKDGAEGQVFIEGRLIEHRPGVLQLFVDAGDGHPVLVILDPADAREYFSRPNSDRHFGNFDGFADFWDNVLRKKYLREPNYRPVPPAR